MQPNLQHTDYGINPGRHPNEHHTDASKFLASIWGASDDGSLSRVHFIAEPAQAGWRHHPVHSLVEAVRKAQKISLGGKNAYFACAEYFAADSRKGDNANKVRSFWLDIDCGDAKAAEGKGYATKSEGHAELIKFCREADMPMPNALVDSGNGLHVYWVLDADLAPEEWRAYSRVWKALAAKYGLRADPSRTADIASVLRVPGTTNWKDPANPKLVRLKYLSGVTEWAGLKAVLDKASCETAADAAQSNLGDLTDGLTKDYPPMPETPEHVERVRSMLAAIPADCGRGEWRNVVWAVQATGWGCATQLAREWSMSAAEKYDDGEFDKVVASFTPSGGVGFGTLVHHAKRHGWTESACIEGDRISVALHEFNARYFVGRICGDVYVFDERDEAILAGGMTFTAFRQLHAGYTVDGKNIAAHWLNWSVRRTYQKLIFDPSGRGEDGTYNTWRGLSVEPVPGACERILDHIRMVWCSGNIAQFDYVVRWLALLVQQPWRKPGVALVLRSREGSGKTIIVQILLDILGPHGFTAAQKDQVAGRFNGHLFDKLLVVLEEAFFAGDPAAVSATKALVTNSQLGYEAKGKDAFSAANYAHVISLTNHGWAVPAGEDSRRWMVLDVDDARRGDHSYFSDLSAEIAGGGVAALLHHLMGIDIAGWNPSALPESKALRAQQMETLSRSNPVAAWWLNVLAEGSFTVEGGAIDWRDLIPAADMQDSYLRATARMRGAPTWDTAARQLRKLVPPGALGRVRRTGQGGRQFFYSLPELDEARAYFLAATGVDPCEA